MVHGAVAMAIPTMPEKSCIDLHNARLFEKYSEIQSFINLAIEIPKVSLMLVSWIVSTVRRNYSASYFVHI